MGNSINDLMYRYFREFKNNDNKLPVEIGDGSGGILIMGTDGSNPVPIPVRVDAQGRLILASEVNVDVGDITIGTVEQGDGDPSAVPWNVRFTEPQEVTLTGQVAQEPFVGTEPRVISFSKPSDGLVISNDGDSWFCVLVHEAPYWIAPDEVFKAHFSPFDEVEIKGPAINYFNPDAVVLGEYYHANGTKYSSSTACTSELIPVVPGEHWTYVCYAVRGHHHISFWDADEDYVDGIQQSTSDNGGPHSFTVPTGASYMRMALHIEELEMFMLFRDVPYWPLGYLPYKAEGVHMAYRGYVTGG